MLKQRNETEAGGPMVYVYLQGLSERTGRVESAGGISTGKFQIVGTRILFDCNGYGR